MPNQLDNPNQLKPEHALGLVKSALEPDERKFFEQYLGKENSSLSMGDYLLPILTKGRMQGEGTRRLEDARALRQHITQSVMGEVFKQSLSSTVGEAQTMFPGFPTPPGATSPTGPVQTEQSLVPDTFDIDKLQAQPRGTQGFPPLSVTTPGRQSLNPNIQDVAPLTTTIPGRDPIPSRYTDPGAAPRTLETYGQTVDENALLPRSFQALLEAKIHQSSLRSARTQGVTDAELKLEIRNRRAALKSGAPELYPGETADNEKQLDIYTKGANPDSIEGLDKRYDVAKKSVELSTAGPQAEANLAKTKQETSDMAALLQPKIDALIAKAKLDNLSGGQLGQKLFNAEQLLKLREGAENLNVFKVLDNRGLLPGDSSNVLLKSILSKIAPDLIASGMDPNFLQKFLGLDPSGLKLTPKDIENPVPSAVSPASTKDDFAGAPAGKNEGDTLKDGDKPVARWTNGKWQAIR